MFLPSFTEATILQYTTQESFQRGREYYQRGAVLSIVRRDQTLQAQVEGSDEFPYRVFCQFEADVAMRATCTCGKQKEWQEYLADLLSRHKRKYKLMPML